VVTFRFGDRTFPCRVVRLKPQPIRRDRSGKALIVRGEIEIEEVHIPGTSRTSRAEKGLQTYQVAGMSETWEYIAHTVFNDESLADALADYNPRPADFSPILPQGTVVMIPPWAFARSYQTTEGRRPWL